ncbi:hypothetical protein M0P98_02780 [bacterium]|nr:hypothetical protein [bacterium]
MIKVQVNMLVSLYLLLSIAILVLWMIFEWQRKPVSNIREHSFLWECPTCLYIYIDSCSESISKCPQCQTLHRRQEKV